MQKTFTSVHQEQLSGTLSMFDRIIFKGHLSQLFMSHGMLRLLAHDRVLLKDFGQYVEQVTAQLKAHAEQLAQASGRPNEYLEAAFSARRGPSKEDRARAIAERDGLAEGLVCVFRTLEGCQSFDIRKNPERGKLELVRRPRKCLHYYFYFIDREFGWMHIRLQSWFPWA